MNLRVKILSGFLILSMMLFTAGVLSICELNKMGHSVQALLDENYKSIDASKIMIEALEREDSGVLLLMSGDWDNGRSIIKEADRDFQKAFDIAENNITIPGEKEPFAQLIILFFTLQCAYAGSTSGGIKADRIVLLWKSFLRCILRLRHPKAIAVIKVNQIPIDDEVVETGLIYILIYLTTLLISSLLITSFRIDIMTAFSGVAAAMGNVGPGFGSVGSLNNYGHLPDFVKWVLTIDMLVGRLEIFGLILFAGMRWW